MGTSLIRGYDIEKFPSNSGGFQGFWKIYTGQKLINQQDLKAVKQDQTKKCVSIFLLEKKSLFQRQLRQQEKDQILDFYRKEITIIQKFKHPLLLSILEPLKEDEKCIAFITERITHSMHTLIQNNMLQVIYPSELELKSHIAELVDTLQFLHKSMKICHCSICPENIYIVDGKWKLAGLNFAVQFNNLNEAIVPFPSDEQFLPNFNFVAPEIVCEKKCGQSSDLFSLGMLLSSLCKAKSLSQGQINNAFQLIGTANASIYLDRIKSFLEKLHEQQFFNVASKNLQIIIQQTLQFQPTDRIGLDEIMRSGWMNDPLLLTIKQLESLELKQNDIKSQQVFLQGLSKIIFKFESPILMRTVIPLMTELLVNCLQLSPQLLSILFNIMNKSLEPNNEDKTFTINKQQALNLIWPKLKAFLQNKEMPAQSLYLILNNLSLFQQYISAQDIDACILPLILKSMDCQVPKLQLIALSQFKFLQSILSWQILKSKVIQRLINLCTNQKVDVEVQKQALSQISENIQQFDKQSLENQILTMLEKMNQNPTISLEMSSKILWIYDYISQQANADLISNRILPQLIPLLGDQRLSKSQFKNYMETVRKLLDKIEKQRQDNFDNIPGQRDFDAKQIEGQIQQNLEISLPQIKNELQQEMTKSMNNEQAFSNEFDFLKLFQPELDVQTNQEPKVLLNPEKEKPISLYEKQRPLQAQPPIQEQTSLSVIKFK